MELILALWDKNFQSNRVFKVTDQGEGSASIGNSTSARPRVLPVRIEELNTKAREYYLFGNDLYPSFEEAIALLRHECERDPFDWGRKTS